VEPWLSYSGTEIANGVRTLSYLRRGLGGTCWYVPASGADFNDVSQLACFCEELNDGPYVDPATDAAPWFDAVKPESDSFLGLYPLTIDLVPSFGRYQSPSGIVGTSLGRLVRGGATIQVRGWLISATQAGNEYGERWLLAALQGACASDGCDIGTLCVLPTCPEGAGYSAANYRTLYRAGLVDYVPAKPLSQGYEWYVREVSFQFRSELPWMYEDADSIVAPVTARRGLVAGLASTGEWPGEAGIRVKVRAGVTPVGPFRITGVPVKDSSQLLCAGAGGQSGATALWNLDQNWKSDATQGREGVSSAGFSRDHDVFDLTGHGWSLSQGASSESVTLERYQGVKYAAVRGAGCGISCPDSVALSGAGDLDVTVAFHVESWAYGSSGFYDLASKWGAAGQRSWLLRWNRSTRNLEFLHSTDGTATVSTSTFPFDPHGANGSTSIPESAAISDRTIWYVRVNLQLDTGAAQHVKRWWVSTNPLNAIQVKAEFLAGATSVKDSTAACWFGGKEETGGYFRGGIYKGSIALAGSTKADPNIHTDATPTAATFSDGVNTWTFVRAASGLKTACVYRSMFITSDDGTLHRQMVLQKGPDPVNPDLGQFAANESFTCIWYGKFWGTTTGQLLMARRGTTTPGSGGSGAGWEIRRGTTLANQPEVLISDGSVSTGVNSSGAITPGTPVGVALVRDVSTDRLICVVNGAASFNATDVTTGAISGAGRLTIGGAADSLGNVTVASAADSEFYAGAIIHGKALSPAEIVELTSQWATVDASLPSPISACFDVIANLDAGEELTLDGATHEVVVRRSSDGVVVGGLANLEIDGPLTWPEMGPCSDVCWSVDFGHADTDVGAGVLVSIDQFNREM